MTVTPEALERAKKKFGQKSAEELFNKDGSLKIKIMDGTLIAQLKGEPLIIPASHHVIK